MGPTDAAENIREHCPDDAEAEGFRSRVAVLIAALAMLLAITSLGGGNASEDMLGAHVEASNRWAFYQAKNIRQTDNRLAADQLEVQLQLHGERLTPQARQSLQAKIDDYRATAERYDNEPDPADPQNPLKGEGKQQLMAQAKDWARQLETSQKQDPNFDAAEVLFQIAIVLGSVAILILSRWLLALCLALSGIAFLLMLNGFFLFLPNLF